MTRAIVIGGGIAGLSSAALLARDGYDVTLLEKNAAVGGRAGSFEMDGFRFDTGPSWYLMPEVFDHFFRLMGTSAQEQYQLLRLDPGYRVFFEEDVRSGTPPLDIRDSREANLDLFEQREPGSRQKMSDYLDSAKDTYEIAKRRFLYTSFAKFGPLLRGDVLKRVPKLLSLLRVSLADYAARYVTSPTLQQVLGYPAVFLGSSPFITPSMYHLMSYLDLEDGVLYPVGGFHKVITAIEKVAEGAGVTIIRNATVTAIETDGPGAGARVTGVTYRGASGGKPKTLEADVVVSSADLHHSETELLPPAQQTYPQKWWDTRVAGPSAVLVYLGVRGRMTQLDHHNLFFTSDWNDNFGRIFNEPRSIPDPASIYVCRPNTTDPFVAPGSDTNLFILIPVPADPSIGNGGMSGKGSAQVEAAADAAIAQIARWAKVPDLAERIIVRRTIGPADFAGDLNTWHGTALGPSHILKQSAFFRAGNKSKKVRGLYYSGGSTIPGIGLPMCLISSEILIKRLRGDGSTEPLPEPLFPTVDGTARA
jgi:phytoene desaturase